MQLPNAPLVEVIFELHWNLLGTPTLQNAPSPFRTDPGYPYLVSGFPKAADKAGYVHQREVNSSTPLGPLAYVVQHRFQKHEDVVLPLWQIGPGIFTCNDSSTYEWASFRTEAARRAIDPPKVGG